MNPLCIRARTACLVLALSACLPAGAATQARKAPAAQDRTAHGLIVQLRDAPTHEALARERAQARGERQSERERARWQAVLDHLKGDAALARAVPLAARGVARRDPVGASAQVLRFERPLSAGEAEHVMQSLAARPEVAWVEPNVRERPQQMASAEPSDYYYRLGLAGQWWLRDVGQGGNASPIEMRLRGVPGFVGAWFQRTVGSPNAVVAVLDTGITCHPDLGNTAPSCIGGAILPGYDFVADPAYANDGGGRDADPRDPGDWVDAADRARDAANFGACDEIPSSWHGTAIAGQLAALTNGGDGDPMRPGGVAAMNWNGRVLPVRVAGKCGADVADIVDGMRWAAGLPVAGVPPNPNPARIINISFGGSAACGNLYQQAIDELRALPNGGAVVVAAAGNGWSSTISRPASCNGVVGVGALNRDGFKSNYSNFGPKVVVSTVGGDDNDGTWGPYLADSGIVTIGNASATSPGLPTYYGEFGTSFSTPIVAGAVSLMLSVNPALTVEQVIQGLRASARPHVTSSVPGVGSCSDANPGRCLCTSATCGAGILDVKRALDFAAAPTSYAPPMLSAPDVDSPELRSAVALGQDRPANPLPPPQASGGGGGGASSAPWIVALLLATCALGAAQRLSSRKARTRCRRAG